VKLPAAPLKRDLHFVPTRRGASHSIGSTGGMGVSFQNRGVSRPVRQRSGQVGRPGNRDPHVPVKACHSSPP
jgi:hypothetical protein